MEEKRILITGSSGLVGTYFCRLKALRKYRVYTSFHLDPTNLGTSVSVDLCNSLGAFKQVINELEPEIVVHIAAMTDVDQCERERNAADNINHLSVRELADYISNRKECFLLYVSTDYVFDGEKGNYMEADNTNPLNWYGMTKLLGEKELLECNSENWCIARTSTPFGVHAKKLSFPLFVVKNLSREHEINVLTDQITSPTYALNLAEMIYEIIDNRVKGIIHLSGSSQISRFNQALEIASAYHLNKDLIKPANIEEMKWKARRPKNSSLNVSKAGSKLVKEPMQFKESILLFSEELQQEMGWGKNSRKKS
jgi:dTDP-4-dehydrorhamnose reductase